MSPHSAPSTPPHPPFCSPGSGLPGVGAGGSLQPCLLSSPSQFPRAHHLIGSKSANQLGTSLRGAGRETRIPDTQGSSIAGGGGSGDTFNPGSLEGPFRSLGNMAGKAARLHGWHRPDYCSGALLGHRAPSPVRQAECPETNTHIGSKCKHIKRLKRTEAIGALINSPASTALFPEV